MQNVAKVRSRERKRNLQENDVFKKELFQLPYLRFQITILNRLGIIFGIVKHSNWQIIQIL